MDFVSKFNYIREAGTPSEEKGCFSDPEELKSFGMESHIEEFSFDTWEITKSRAYHYRALS